MDNRYNFAVTLPGKEVDTRGFYKKGIVDLITKKYPWLTAAGLDSPFYTKSGKLIRGIEYAGPNNLLTFGTAKNHDVNWVQRADYAREKGHAPIYDLAKDYSTVVNRLDAFAKSRKPAPAPRRTYSSNCYCNDVFYIGNNRVEEFDAFYKIGTVIIPRYPAVNDYYKAVTPEVTELIIKIKYLF